VICDRAQKPASRARALWCTYKGRKWMHHADEHMARITVERLMKHLAQSGYVVMKKPEAGPQNYAHPHPHKGDPPEGSG
jgi:hypothetical protein